MSKPDFEALAHVSMQMAGVDDADLESEMADIGRRMYDAGEASAREEAAKLVMARCQNRWTGAVLARLIRECAPAIRIDENGIPVGVDPNCERCGGDGDFMGDPCTCITVN